MTRIVSIITGLCLVFCASTSFAQTQSQLDAQQCAWQQFFNSDGQKQMAQSNKNEADTNKASALEKRQECLNFGHTQQELADGDLFIADADSSYSSGTAFYNDASDDASAGSLLLAQADNLWAVGNYADAATKYNQAEVKYYEAELQFEESANHYFTAADFYGQAYFEFCSVITP